MRESKIERMEIKKTKLGPFFLITLITLLSFFANFYICYKVGVQLHSFACGYLVVQAPFVGEIILSPLNDFDTLVESQLTVDWFISGLSILFHCSMSSV